MQGDRSLPLDGDPAELAAQRDTIRLAFVAALQHLPPKQRAVLILREVLRWPARGVAELLDTSVTSVKQRPPTGSGDSRRLDLETTSSAPDAHEQELVAQYVAAFESYDISSLVSLLVVVSALARPDVLLELEAVAVVPN